MFLIRIFIICLLVLCVSGTGFLAEAQTFDSEDYRRFSLSLHGGVTLENDDTGLRLFGSNFNTLTNHSYNFGGGLQYAITPFWSLGAEYRYITVEGTGGSFETDIHSIGLKNYFNFNRLYREHRLSEYLNPYLTLGIGRDFFTFESDDESISNHEIYFSGGFGLAFNVTETVELFGQYDLQIGSNSFDNIRSGFPSDLLGLASGGVRIYLGSRDKRRMSMSPPTVSLTRDEYYAFRGTGQRMNQLEEQIEQRDEDMEAIKQQVQSLSEAHASDMTELEELLDKLNVRLAAVEDELENIKSRLEEKTLAEDTGLTQHLVRGHYVQIFASFDNEESAQTARRIAIAQLNDTIENPSEMVIISRRDRFFEVRIGAFQQYQQAAQVQQTVTDIFEDAFVVTFPRPVELEERYRDIQIVD